MSMTQWHEMNAKTKQDAVTALLKEGKTYSQVAEIFNVTRNAVAGAVNRFKTRVGMSPEELGKLQTRKASMKKLKEEKAERQKHLYDDIIFVPHVHRAPSVAIPSDRWAPLAGSVPVTLMDLKPQHCRWPVGNHMFCGQRSEDNTYGRIRYCATHNAMAYRQWEVKGNGPRAKAENDQRGARRWL